MSGITVSKNDPIGIFDSGVGGLTVAKEIAKRLPCESLVYLGDTARTPYGTKAGETVKRFTLQCVKHLSHYGIKALVVACNTASAYALPTLQRHFKIPIIGVIEPGSRAALQDNAKASIGVIGTRATIQSKSYVSTIRRLQPKQKVYSVPCPLLVPLVEEGWLNGKISKKIIEQYLGGLLDKGIGKLILGCTHYPALKPLISEVCGSKVDIIDSAEEVTKELKNVLALRELLTNKKNKGRQKYLVTDVPEQFIRVGTQIIGKKIDKITRVLLSEAIK